MHAHEYDLRRVGIDVIREVCEEHHNYGSSGGRIVYGWAVFEEEKPVAVYAWQPPAPGAAKAVSPGELSGALMLSRMAAIPREQRTLNHVSRPLRRQKDRLIDRGRWPVLVTYSDEGEGHTGHVYKCSGWTPTTRRRAPFYLLPDGSRASSYANGKHGGRGLTLGGFTWIQRWEHRACQKGMEREWMLDHGWIRLPRLGKRWRSGSQAFTWVNRYTEAGMAAIERGAA